MGVFSDTYESIETGDKVLASARRLLEAEGYEVIEPGAKDVDSREPSSQGIETYWYGEEGWEAERRKVWLQAWCATANSSTCIKAEVAESYAEACLAAFDKRFPSK